MVVDVEKGLVFGGGGNFNPKGLKKKIPDHCELNLKLFHNLIFVKQSYDRLESSNIKSDTKSFIEVWRKMINIAKVHYTIQI